MTLQDHHHLGKYTTELNSGLLTNQLETNLQSYFQWGLLNAGGFTDVTISTSGAYGGSFDRLRMVEDPAYVDGQVWEAPRKDWVWETGLYYSKQPIQISGVYVNGVFNPPSGATLYPHHYNYPLGRVIFDTALPKNSIVQIEYSYRNVQTYIADAAGWWDEIQYDSFRVDFDEYLNQGSGAWDVLANHRVQLPAIIIEAVPRRVMRPYELGTVGNWVYQDVQFHILAESRYWRNQLVDAITLEKDRTIWLYDNNQLLLANEYPLDYRGMPVPGFKTYPYFVDNYRYKKATFSDMSVLDMRAPTQRLYTATVNATVEVIMA